MSERNVRVLRNGKRVIEEDAVANKAKRQKAGRKARTTKLTDKENQEDSNRPGVSKLVEAVSQGHGVGKIASPRTNTSAQVVLSVKDITAPSQLSEVGISKTPNSSHLESKDQRASFLALRTVTPNTTDKVRCGSRRKLLLPEPHHNKIDPQGQSSTYTLVNSTEQAGCPGLKQIESLSFAAENRLAKDETAVVTSTTSARTTDINTAPEPAGPEPSTKVKNRHQETDKTEHKVQDWFDPSDVKKVQLAKSVLSVSHCEIGKLPLCRDAEVRCLDGFLRDAVLSASGVSVYVSGTPGTGKSLTVHEVVRRSRQYASSSSLLPLPPAMVSINCMAITDTKAVFDHIASGLEEACKSRPIVLGSDSSAPTDPITYPGPPDVCGHEEGGLHRLKKIVTAAVASTANRRRSMTGRNSRGVFIVILDELDHLLSQDPSLLYELFMLPHLPSSRLSLIGIANSIDLTERMLPKLQAMGCKPNVVCFPAYPQAHISAVITQRLSRLPGLVFAAPALAFCYRKVSAGSGDMRRALETCSAALDKLVDFVRESQRDKSNDDDEALEAALASTTGPPVPLPRVVGVREMAAAISELWGGVGASSAVCRAIQQLPLQQQLLLCACCKAIGQDPATPAKQPLGSTYSPAMPSAKKTPARRLSTASLGSISRRNSFGLGVAGSPAMTSSRSCDTTLGQLQDSYTAMCKLVGVGAVSSSEFQLMCATLADCGMICIAGHNREERRKRVTLSVTHDDLLLALNNQRMLRNVLEGCCRQGVC